jgi:hypothetical protein
MQTHFFDTPLGHDGESSLMLLRIEYDVIMRPIVHRHSFFWVSVVVFQDRGTLERMPTDEAHREAVPLLARSRSCLTGLRRCAYRLGWPVDNGSCRRA